MIAPRFLPRAAVLAVLACSVFAAGGAAVAGIAAPSSAPAGYQVSRFPVAGNPWTVAADSADGYVYVASPAAYTVSVVDEATGATVKTISLAPYYPTALAVDPATDTVYITGYDNGHIPVLGAVYRIDGATGTVLKSSTSSGLDPQAIAVDSATSTLYILNGYDIDVMNAASLAMTGAPITAPSGGFLGIAVDEAAGKLYASGGANLGGVRSGALWTIDGTTGAISGPVDLGWTNAGARAPAFDPANDTVYVANYKSVLSVDPGTGTITHTFPVEASYLAVDTARGRVFATSPYNWVSVLDAASQSVVATFPRGGFDVAVDNATGQAYVPSGHSDGVWTITPAASTTMSPVISTPVPTLNEVAGTALSAPLPVTAIPAATCTAAGTLPAGVTLTPACVITGTPAKTVTGGFSIAVTAANGVAPDYAATVNIQVYPPLRITSPPTATFVVGKARSFTVATTPFPWPGPQLSETGPLPAGVTFTASSGVLSGTPAAGTAGVYHLTFSANGNQGSSASQAFTLTVAQGPGFTSPAKATFTHGVRGTFTIRTTAFPAADLTEQGTLPGGMTFRAGSGGSATISGTPSASTKGHTYVVTITAHNVGGTATQKLTIVVR